MAKLEELTKLVIDQYLPKAIDSTVDKVGISMDEYINRRQLAGATDQQIIAELQADMRAEISRVFGVYETGVKSNVTGAINIASTHGAVSVLADEDNDRLFRWQTTGDNICEDCLARHGEEDTMRGWTIRGLPGEFGSRCTTNCACVLVDTGIDLPPIKMNE